MNPPDTPRVDLLRQWVHRAQKDYDLAQHLIEEGSVYREAIAFNAQQAAEKFLKAFLVLHQIYFPKTHDIGRLLDLVSTADPDLSVLLRPAITLNPYGVEYRYPGDAPAITTDDAVAAFELTDQVRAAVLVKLQPYLK